MKPRWNGQVVAGYVIWATLAGWFLSPAGPSWPETLVAWPLVLVAAYLIESGRKADRG